jgi:hypothetical protein
LCKRLDKDRTRQQQEERKHSSTNKQATNEPRASGALFFCNPIAAGTVYTAVSPREEVATMKIAALFTASFLVFVAWAASPASFAGDGRSINTVNGAVDATAGETYDTLSTVNGQVRIGRGVTANEAKTVNGQLLIEDDVKLGSASTVNGSLRIGEGVNIARQASTVNGGVTLANRSRVGGDVSTVSGGIEIRGAEVAGKLVTMNGDIELSEAARVLGGIHIKKSGGTNWGWGKPNTPEVHICSTCVVEGELRFDRPVELRVDPGAKIGPVIGADVKRL